MLLRSGSSLLPKRQSISTGPSPPTQPEQNKQLPTRSDTSKLIGLKRWRPCSAVAPESATDALPWNGRKVIFAASARLKGRRFPHAENVVGQIFGDWIAPIAIVKPPSPFPPRHRDAVARTPPRATQLFAATAGISFTTAPSSLTFSLMPHRRWRMGSALVRLLLLDLRR